MWRKFTKSYEEKQKELLIKFKEKHGLKYDYSLVNYIHHTVPIIIICPRHGEFSQRARTHKDGHGCARCVGSHGVTTERFSNRAISMYGNTYDYSKTIYTDSRNKLTITCKLHGDFSISASAHLDTTKRQGCKFCNTRVSKGARLIKSILDDLGIKHSLEYSDYTCYDKHVLRFDYALHLQTGLKLVEFDGRQHEKPVGPWGGIAGYNNLRRKDEIKNEWCKRNNIPLLRINHKQLKEARELLLVFIASNPNKILHSDKEFNQAEK